MATEIQSIRWKLSVSSRAITGGITSTAAMSVTPDDPHRGGDRQREHRRQQQVDPPVRTPETSATSGSNVANSSWRYEKKTTAAATRVTPATTHTSVSVTPRTLPNNAASKLRVNAAEPR